MTRPIGGIFMQLDSIHDGQIQIFICGEKITIDQTLIAK
jgi:hypothetical protein